MKIIFPLTALLMLSTPASAVTNLEFFRDESTGKKFHSDIEMSLSGENGNYKSKGLDTNLAFAWDDENSHFMTILEHQWGSHNGSAEKNNSFMHTRYTRKLEVGSGNHIEFFVQGRRDSFLNIRSRLVGGVGYRKTFFNETNNRFNAFGAGLLFEKEKGVNNGIKEDRLGWRLNGYWHHKQPITKSLSANNVIYIQPSLKKISEIRIHDEFRITNKIGKNAEIGFKVTFNYNSSPFNPTKNTDINYGTFVSYNF